MLMRKLGRTGLRVAALCLGGNTFGWTTDQKASEVVLDAYAEAGGNFIDTANIYSGGTSETYLGEFMGSERERIVLATKYTGATRARDVNAAGNSRKNLMDSLHASLKRLRTDYVDLYWVHARDFLTPIEEVMRALDDVVRQGKVLYVGVSDTPAWEVSRANTLAELRGWSAFVGLQIRYSLLDRAVERELLPMAKTLDLTVTPWDVLASGVLAGKYNANPAEAGRAKLRGFVTERALGIAGEVIKVAQALGRTSAQVALNWVRAGQGVIVPLVGARTKAQLDDNLGCLEFELPPEAKQQLDDVSKIELGFPHEFLAQFKPGSVVNHRE